jgi:hypothetical protein
MDGLQVAAEEIPATGHGKGDAIAVERTLVV